LEDIDEKNLSLTIPIIRPEKGTDNQIEASFIYEWRFSEGKLKQTGPRIVIKP